MENATISVTTERSRYFACSLYARTLRSRAIHKEDTCPEVPRENDPAADAVHFDAWTG